MSTRLQELPAVLGSGSNAYMLIKQLNAGLVADTDYRITVQNFLKDVVPTSQLGTEIGEIPVLTTDSVSRPALPAVSGENLTNLTLPNATASTKGVVQLSDSLTSNSNVGGRIAATPFAISRLNTLKANLAGAAFTGGVSVPTIRAANTIYIGTASNSSNQLATTDGTNITLGTTARGLKTFKDLTTHSGNHSYWHGGNDGSGSGLDADLLDGAQGSYYRNASNLNAGTISDARLPTSISSNITGNAATATLATNATNAANATLAASATRLANTRVISLTGDVTGSASFNGTANTAITATVADNSHNHTIANITGLQAALDSKVSGSGGKAPDSDLLDGFDSSYFAIRANAMLRSSGVLTDPNTQLQSSAYRFDPHANNPTNAHYAVVTYGNQSNVVGQLATHFQDGDTYVRSHNTSWSPWAKIWTNVNDGHNSGLDADLLDGLHGSFYRNAGNLNAGVISNDRLPATISKDISGNAATATLATNATNAVNATNATNATTATTAGRWTNARTLSLSGDVTGSVSLDGSSNVSISATVVNNSHTHTIANVTGLQTALNGKLGVSAKAADSTLLNGLAASGYVNTASTQTITGAKTFSQNVLVSKASSPALTIRANSSTVNEGGRIEFDNSGQGVRLRHSLLDTERAPFGLIVERGAGNNQITNKAYLEVEGDIYANSNSRVWHAGNDGSGSGLDADTVDGIQGSSIVKTSGTQTINGLKTFATTVSITALAPVLNFNETGVTNNPRFWLVGDGGTFSLRLNNKGNYPLFVQTNATNDSVSELQLNAPSVKINGGTAWHSGNDGTGSGLDADTVDGHQASSLLDTLESATTRGRTTSTAGSKVWSETNQGRELGNIHVRSIGTDHAGGAITFASSDEGTAHAGIYTRSDGAYGTRMYLATTDSYASGSKTAINIGSTGIVNIVRGINHLKVLNNTVWHAGNDGSGSGLDADTVDGNHASAFGRVGSTNTWTKVNSFRENIFFTENSGTLIRGSNDDWRDLIGINDAAGSGGAYIGKRGYWIRTGNATEHPKVVRNSVPHTLWHAGNDGSGSGLDADTVDGIQGANILRNNVRVQNIGYGDNSTANRTLTIDGYNSTEVGYWATEADGVHGAFFGYNGATNRCEIKVKESGSSPKLVVQIPRNTGVMDFQIAPTISGSKVWTAGNDGSGSGLDADLLDGLHGSSFGKLGSSQAWGGVNTFNANPVIKNGSPYLIIQDSNSTGTAQTGYVSFRDSSGVEKGYVGFGSSGTTDFNIQNVYNPNNGVRINSHIVWHAGNDGSGSGLDADTLDGSHGTAFGRLATNQTWTGSNTWSGANTWTADSAFTKNLTVAGGLSSGRHHLTVGGGERSTTTSVESGYLKIQLPRRASNTMMQFTVEVFEYRTHELTSFRISGYNHTSAWVNTSVQQIVSRIGGIERDVFFVRGATHDAVYIGAANAVWDYPQVIIKDFQNGFSDSNTNAWEDGWNISFTPTLEGVIQKTHTDNLIRAGSANDADRLGGILADQYIVGSQAEVITGNWSFTGNPLFNSITVSNISNSANPLILNRDNQVGIQFNQTGHVTYLGSSNGVLKFGTSTDHSSNNDVYHGGNANSTSIDWRARNITASVVAAANLSLSGVIVDNVGTSGMSVRSTGANTTTELRILKGSDGARQGALFGDASNNSGLLNNVGRWAVQCEAGDDGVNLRADNSIKFQVTRTGNVSNQSLTVTGALISNDRISGQRGEFGYAHGLSGAVGASNWFRSTGDTGWYNATYSGGIHMTDSTWVRIYNGKKFLVTNIDSDSISTLGGVHASGAIVGIDVRATDGNVRATNGAVTASTGSATHTSKLVVSTTPNEFLVGGHKTNATSTGVDTYLRMGQNDKLQFTSNLGTRTVYHSGNSNSTSKTWAASTLTATTVSVGNTSIAAITTTGAVHATKGLRYTYRDGSGITGSYSQTQTADMMIWSIGDSWRTLATCYGMKYEYTSDLKSSAHQITFNNNGVASASIALGSGDFITKGNVVSFFTSDERLKRDIVEITNPLDKVNSLRTATYEKKHEIKDIVEEGSAEQVVVGEEWIEETGLIAQDLEKVLPAVIEEGDDGYLRIKDDGYELQALAFAAIKELSAQVEELKAEVAKLKGK